MTKLANLQAELTALDKTIKDSPYGSHEHRKATKARVEVLAKLKRVKEEKDGTLNIF